MKKILISILLIAHYLNPLQAQIKQGSWMIDGSLLIAQPYYASGTGVLEDQTGIRAIASPQIGYFVSKRLALGGQVVLGGASINAPQNSWCASYQVYHFLPFARYYLTTKRRFKIFYELELEGALQHFKFTSISPISYEDQLNKYYFIVSNKLGANFFLTDNLALEGAFHNEMYRTIGYSPVSNRNQNSSSFLTTALGLTIKMRLFLNTDRQNAAVLAEKYLKKGNFAYGLQARFVQHGEGVDERLFEPSFSYFLSDKWVIGGAFNFYEPLITVKPEIRYYHPITPTTHAILRTQASIRKNSSDRLNPWQDCSFKIGGGLNRFIADNISIEGLLNAHTTFLNYDVNFKYGVTFGFQYFMSRK